MEGFRDGGWLCQRRRDGQPEDLRQSALFRLRAGKIGDPRYAIADVLLDCQSKQLTIGRAELYDKGVQTGVRQADPARPFVEPMSEQPSGNEILALVCTG